MINTKLIRKRMESMKISQGDLAKALDIAQSTCNLKLNNKRQLTLSEADTIASVLKIPMKDFGAYFFA